MNITKEQVDDLNAILKVEVSQEDYQEKVDKVVKDYRKNANIPGFRKGHVPTSLIKKQYGKVILIEEINKILQDSVNDYLNKDEIKILGHPLPKENDSIDWDQQHDFQFEFELGISPEFDVSLSNKDKLTYYKIVADDKLIDKYEDDIAKRYGKMMASESFEEGDLLHGDFVELDEEGNAKQGGIESTNSLHVDLIKDEKVKKGLLGLKPGDAFTFRPEDTFEKASDIAHMLGIDEKVVEKGLDADFRFVVKEVNRVEPAELNKELFDKIFPGQEIADTPAFRAKIAEEAEKTLVRESELKFQYDAMEYLLDKTKFELPNEFIKKWLLSTNEETLTAEKIESDYEQYSKSMRWQLIENKLITTNNIEVSQEALKEHAKEMIRQQMLQMGLTNTQDEMMEPIVANVLQNQDEVKKLYEQLYDKKLLAFYKETFKIKEKEITFDEFVNLADKNKKTIFSQLFKR